MRAIDADALKKDLTRFYDNEVTAKQLIDEQPTIETEPQWIKCSKRLPKEKGLYWVTVKVEYDEGFVILYSDQREWLGQRWGELRCAHCGIDTIIAWMPLPKPFMPKESEE